MKIYLSLLLLASPLFAQAEASLELCREQIKDSINLNMQRIFCISRRSKAAFMREIFQQVGDSVLQKAKQESCPDLNTYGLELKDAFESHPIASRKARVSNSVETYCQENFEKNWQIFDKYALEQSQAVENQANSFANAIVIDENDITRGIAAEYKWIERHAPAYVQLVRQELLEQDGKKYDRLSMRSYSGKERVFYFAIDNFFGKVNGKPLVPEQNQP